MSKQRCQHEITSSEFVEWKVHIEAKRELADEHATRDQHYYAQIAEEIHRIYGFLAGIKRARPLKSFFYKFTRKKQEDKSPSIKERTKRMQSIWFAAVGTPEGMEGQ